MLSLTASIVLAFLSNYIANIFYICQPMSKLSFKIHTYNFAMKIWENWDLEIIKLVFIFLRLDFRLLYRQSCYWKHEHPNFKTEQLSLKT